MKTALLVAGSIAGLVGCGGGPVTNNTQLPTDAKSTCSVAASTFAGWFQSGSVSLNGVVNPDSAQFTNPIANCPFYQWAEQMFLWATSPAPAAYGGGARVFSSPVFFGVSPPSQSDGSRTLIKQSSGFLPRFQLRAAQVGSRGLPILFSVTGQMLEVAQPKAGQKPMVRTATGALVQVVHARLGPNGLPILLGPSNRILELPRKAAPSRRVAGTTVVTQFTIDKIKIFIDPASNIIDVEQGEADNGVLEAQTNSLVYYYTLVNDVYAYFETGLADNKFTATKFPQSLSDLNPVVAFALTANPPLTFPDLNALVVELKTSWVEASSVSNLGSYITMTATIPTYSKTSAKWVQSGQQTVNLALVGIHVVGSVPGHSELIWATFEHFANTPRATYTYVNTSNSVSTRNIDATDPPVDQSGNAAQWLFATNGAGANNSGPFNDMFMQYNNTPTPPEIDALTGTGLPGTISPSDTIRWKAFGVASDTEPNPLEQCPVTTSPCPTADVVAAANTEIISINNSVRGQLASGDVRANYILTGATWTEGGALPSGIFTGSGGNEVGTSVLSNTTMETYQQGSDTHLTGGSNCFDCHNSSTSYLQLSHIFTALKPLF